MEQSSVTELPVCGAERREEGLNKAVKQGDCSARERRCLVRVRQENKLELGDCQTAANARTDLAAAGVW